MTCISPVRKILWIIGIAVLSSLCTFVFLLEAQSVSVETTFTALVILTQVLSFGHYTWVWIWHRKKSTK